MSLEGACALVSAFVTAGWFVLGLFVSNRIASAEKAILKAVHEEFMPREIAEAMFDSFDKRLDGHLERCHPRLDA